MIGWKKIVTRETTLLERYLRMIGYSSGVGKISELKAKNIITVSYDSMSEQYFDVRESSRSEKIALQEYLQGKSQKLFNKFGILLTTLAHLTNKIKKLKKANCKELLILFEDFFRQYGFGRGIIYYGHFAEAIFFERLKKELKKIKIEKINEYISVLTAPTKTFRGLEHFLSPTKTVEFRQKKILKKITLTNEAKNLIEYLQWLSYYHEVGERVTSESFKQLDHLLALISKQSGIAVNNLHYYILPEIKDILLKGKKLSQQEIYSRENFFVLLMTGGKIKLYTGDKGKKIEHREVPRQKIKRVRVFNGQVVCIGKPISGAVKVIRKQKDISKMKKGDILVSPMTTPRLMSAVKLASAIVTDEGGITCHAAIVSRELNIPCVIGTKIASKILQDGDLLKVDTQSGVVTILKKNK